MKQRNRMTGWAVLALAVVAVAAQAQAPNTLTDDERAAGWRLLFDGTNPGEHWRGFRRDALPEQWVAEDGWLKVKGGGDIITREAFENFELQIDWQTTPGANSGIMFRVTEDVDPSWASGPEVQIFDDAAHGTAPDDFRSAGSMYELYPPSADKQLNPAGQPNQFRLVVQGDHVQHWLNGRRIAEYTIGSDDWNERVARSKFANFEQFGTNRRGHIVLQDHGQEVWFRNIKIRELPGEAGDDAVAAGDVPATGPIAGLPSVQERLPLKVLVFGHTAGFYHDAIPIGAEVLTELGAGSGLFDATVTNDPAQLTPEFIRDFDIIVFNNTTGEIPLSDEAKAAFMETIRQPGKGFIGFHAATDTYYQWPEYGEMIGGYFSGHPWNEQVTLKVEQPDHPAAEGLPGSWVIADEIYQHRDWDRNKVTVLYSLDPAGTDMTKQGMNREDGDYALAWVKPYGQGRVAYLGLGHRHEVWRNPEYQRSILGTIKWIAGLDWRSDEQLQTLVQVGDAAGLAATIQSRPEALRSEPIKALAHLGTPEAIQTLVGLVGDGNLTDVRIAALDALGRLADAPLEPIVQQTDDPSSVIRVSAVRALGRRGTQAAESRLRELLSSPVIRVRLAAVEALGQIDSPDARMAVARMVTSNDAQMQTAALRSLGQTDDPMVWQHIRQYAQDNTNRADAPAIMPTLLERLGEHAANDPAAVAVLRRAYEEGGNPAIRAAALRGLAASNSDAARELLPRALFSADNDIARTANEVIGQVEGLQLGDMMTPYIGQWLVVGPFDNPGGQSAHDRAFGPEEGVDPAAQYDTRAGQQGWREVNADDSGMVNFLNVYPDHRDNSVAYAYTVIHAPRAMEAELRLGSDDGAKVWLNGQEVLSVNVPRGLSRDQDRVRVQLRQGANPLLVKVMQGAGDWSLAVRLGSPEGGLGELRFERPAVGR